MRARLPLVLPRRRRFLWTVLIGAAAVLLALALVLALAPAASAASPRQQHTAQIPGTRCSVTVWQEVGSGGATSIGYGGGTSCAGNVGQRTLNVVPQVYNANLRHPRWFSIYGVGLYQGPTPVSPLRRSATMTAVPGHVYRLLAYGQVTLADGTTHSATVCADCAGPAPRLSITPRESGVYSIPPTSVALPGVSCVVSQRGATFPLINNTPVIIYGGDLGCGTAVTGRRTLTIAVEVLGQGGGPRRYFTVTGSSLSTTFSRGFYAGLSTGRTVYTGHPYRVVATGAVTDRGRTVTATARSLTTGP